MAMFKGALPLIHARIRPNGKVAGDFCPRPLSRKKLKALLSQRPNQTTGRELARLYARKPGPGRFKRGAAQQHERLSLMEHRGPSESAMFALLSFILGVKRKANGHS